MEELPAGSALTQTKGFSIIIGRLALQVASPSDADEYVPFSSACEKVSMQVVMPKAEHASNSFA